MPRRSVKENKTVYQQRREELGLTREKASELIGTITPEKLEKIENERTEPSSYDVLDMAEAYNDPELCNYFCSNQCPIGRKYVPEVHAESLSSIVLEMIAAFNKVDKCRERLVDIAADGIIDSEELCDFEKIQAELEKISMAVEAMQLWAEKMKGSAK